MIISKLDNECEMEIKSFPSHLDFQFKGFNPATEYISTIKKLVEILSVSGSVAEPFSGLNTTLIGLLEAGWRNNYFGVDINHLMIELSKRRIVRYFRQNGVEFTLQKTHDGYLILYEKYRILLRNNDAYNFSYSDFDWIITSPPYYSYYKYTENPRDLSNIKEYKSYLQKLTEIIKMSKRCIFILAPIVIDERLYDIPYDLSKLIPPNKIIRIVKPKRIDYALVW